jgi:hypothetical protein
MCSRTRAPRRLGVRARRAALGQEGHLVAAQAGQDVARAHDAPQPVGDEAQELVADVVAQRVVDELEAVDVDEEERRPAAIRLLAGQVVQQDPAVPQAGERVAGGVLDERALRPRPLDRDPGERGGVLDQPELGGGGRPRLAVVEREGPQDAAVRGEDRVRPARPQAVPSARSRYPAQRGSEAMSSTTTRRR